MRRIAQIAMLPTAALVLAACGGGDAEQPAQSAPAATLTSGQTGGGQTAGSGQALEGGDPGDALFGTGADVGGPYGELRDGVWAVGPAGEVEFRVTGSDSLELVEVRPNEGWSLTEQEAESDKIDADFRQGPVDYEIEIEIDDGVLEIEIDQDIDPAEGGAFAVGEAATVNVTVDSGRLVLGDVAIGDGWTEVKREVDTDDIELDFRREGNGFFEMWEIHADLDDGALDIEVDYEIEGRFAQ